MNPHRNIFRYTKQDHTEWLNEIEIPFDDLKSNGGRIPDNADYGDWIRRNDPIAFSVSYNERLSNLDYYNQTNENPA